MLSYIDRTTGNLKVEGDLSVAGPIDIMSGFGIAQYDYISLGYTGSNLTTVKYYSGGAGGTLLATLTLVYDGSNILQTITKS